MSLFLFSLFIFSFVIVCAFIKYFYLKIQLFQIFQHILKKYNTLILFFQSLIFFWRQVRGSHSWITCALLLFCESKTNVCFFWLQIQSCRGIKYQSLHKYAFVYTRIINYCCNFLNKFSTYSIIILIINYKYVVICKYLQELQDQIMLHSLFFFIQKAQDDGFVSQEKNTK